MRTVSTSEVRQFSLLEMSELCSRTAIDLQRRSLCRSELLDLTSTLQLLAHSLEEAVQMPTSFYGKRREVRMADAAIKMMNGSLRWIQWHDCMALDGEVQGKLVFALQSGHDAIMLLTKLEGKALSQP